MSRLYNPNEEVVLFEKVATIASGGNIDIKQYMHNIITVVGSNTASFTIKFKASTQEDVNFSQAASATNRWAYVELVNLADRTDIKKGSVGVVVTSDGVSMYEANINGCAKITAEVSTYTSGKASVYIRNFNNK